MYCKVFTSAWCFDESSSISSKPLFLIKFEDDLDFQHILQLESPNFENGAL